MRIPLFSWLFLMPIFLLFISFCIPAVSGQCLGNQQSLLLQLKNSLEFPKYSSTKLVHWNQSVDCCSWEGVTCTQGRVIGLDLSYESINGGLDFNSSSLFSLQHLQHLNLAYNNFFGENIPSEFDKLKNLSYLNLSNAGFTGQIPIEISHLTRLVTLDLSTSFELSLMYFTFNPLKLENPNLNMLVQNLSELMELYLDGVNISAQGSEWCEALSSSLPNLRVLSMSSCDLSGPFNSSLLNLQSLSVIRLNDNNFSGEIPNSIANLTQLFYLDMSSNNFNGSIPSFSMVKNLNRIYLHNNDLTGPITSTRWEELLNLEFLDLSHNSLEGSIPVSLFSLPSLQCLALSNNRFSGPLNEFSNVSSYLLNTIDFSYNNLTGPIPMSIFELIGLERLLLSSNKFSGSLQLNMIQPLRNLSELSLSDNLLIEYTGPDSSLSSFPQMSIFSMASNKLKSFPDFLRNQSKLTKLDLSDNQILGKIPNWIWKLPNLHTLNLSYNYLVTLDFPLLNISSLGFLDLRCNQLQGQLLVVPSSVTSLDFSMNKFYGSIPGSICNATNLLVLDLSNNFLSGTVPQCLIEMSDTQGVIGVITVLNLRNNNLTGAIYDVFGGNCSFETLDLNGNQLEGKLPKSLAMCKQLTVLDIGNNHIKDAFPCYLNIMMLRVLILRSNEFYGPVGCPGPNATWPMLQIMDLASNNFAGRLLEKSFSNWSAMEPHEYIEPFEFLQYEIYYMSLDIYYQDDVTVTTKGRSMELVKILTIFTVIDLSCNNFVGPIPEELGELKFLYILNLSHNAFTGQIPSSLGKLSNLESLDLSNNEFIGEIPVQLADGLTFLSFLNLSFNQLVGKIPQVKQFATFSETSYEGNTGLYGCPLKENCTYEEPRSTPPTIGETPSNSGNAIDWSLISVELGFVFGFATVVGPLLFWKKWRIYYYKHVDDIFFKMFPKLYIRIENRRKRAHKNQGRRAH